MDNKLTASAAGDGALQCERGNYLLTKTTKSFRAITSVATKPALGTTDELAESVEPEHIGVVMDLGRRMSGWASTEVFELKGSCEHPQQEWRGIGKNATEHNAIRTIKRG